MPQRRRLLRVVFPAAVALAAAGMLAEAKSQQPQTGLAAAPLSRFGGDRDGDARLDGNDRSRPADIGAVAVTVHPDPAVCAAGSRARWSVEGARLERVQILSAGPPECEVRVDLAPRLPRARGDKPPRVRIAVAAVRTRAEEAMTLDDRLVVALGDSVGSGEGNPPYPERQCHRSPAAGFEQAARLLASKREETSLTFVNLACSGARVPRGLLGKYDGIAPRRGTTLRAQVDRLRALAARRRVDAVLLSVGANDVHFGAVVAHCLAAVPRPCYARRFDPERRGAGLSADAEVGHALERLPERYARLEAELSRLSPPPPVIVTEYFDPTRGPRGRTCGLLTISRDEAAWASDELLAPLNLEIAAAAKRHGWRRAGGIADAFEGHGLCARGRRWVVTPGEAARQPDPPNGALHPNREGHRAIAERVVPQLASALGLEPQAASKDERLRDHLWDAAQDVLWLLLGAVVLGFVGLRVARRWQQSDADTGFGRLVRRLLAVPGAVAVRLEGGTMRRLIRLFTPRALPDPTGMVAARPRLPRLRLPRGVPELIARGAAFVLSALTLLGFVTFVGGAILWVRFWSARIPADQAVAATPEFELVAVGAQAIALFAVLGIVAVLVVWLLDGRGRPGRATRRGLAVLVVAELLVTVFVESFNGRERLQLMAGFAIATLLLLFLVDRAMKLPALLRGGASLLPVLGGWLRSFLRRQGPETEVTVPGRVALATTLVAIAVVVLALEEELSEWAAAPVVALAVAIGFRDAASTALRDLARSLPLALLGVALYFSIFADGRNRLILIAVPIALAAALFVVPLGIAGAVEDARDRDLEPPRIALAAAGLAVLLILLGRDEWWLLITAAIAVALAGGCLLIAGASGSSFGPYGLMVLISVPIFGATMAAVRNLNSPQVQPVAALTKAGETVCGIYVGDDDNRLWLAQVELSELGHVRRPRPRRSTLTWVPRDQIERSLLGPLQPVALAEDQALALRARLEDEPLAARTRVDAKTDRVTACGAGRRPPPVAASAARALAEKYQPELILDRHDRFWPVPVRTIFALQDRRAHTCRRIHADNPKACVRVASQAELPWSGGEGEWLEYPAADDLIGDQHRLMVEALGSVDPVRSSRLYFLVSRPRGREPETTTVQYWSFYTFNYLRVAEEIKSGGFHEGDFEHVGVLLSARTKQPRFLWMARHEKGEGRVFSWDEPALQKTAGGRPLVFVARGSHASYESCGRQLRPAAPLGLVDDRPTCDVARQLHLPAESTPMTDMSRVPWACWAGLYGHRRGKGWDRIPYLISDGPRGPLFQQEFGEVVSRPCVGLRDPGAREGVGEEVLPLAVATELRRRVGRLDPLVDQCADWFQPPVVGSYLVACDPPAYQRYVRSGFEEQGTADVRIDDLSRERPRIGAASLPAILRDANLARLDGLRVRAARRTDTHVYASCARGRRQLAALFTSVVLEPDRPLRVDDRDQRVWRLRDERGATVAKAAPELVRGSRIEGRLRCGR